MYNREESKRIRQEFWINFGKRFPRKWLLYHTKIKDLTLKFTFTQNKAEVSIDIEHDDALLRQYYFEKMESLKGILRDEFLPEVVFAENYELDNGKIISRIYVRKEEVTIHNKQHWEEVQTWLYRNMDALEKFFLEYKDFIDQ